LDKPKKGCKYGGDVSANERLCLHPKVTELRGFESPTDVASKVDLGVCGVCLHFRLEEKNGNS